MMETSKVASALIYLVEELGDARLLCEQLQRYVDRSVQLIEKSEKKDHFFEVAGDLIQAIPETTRKLHQALQAVALATNRLDYEEVKQTLRPEKADELENVLDEVRIRPVRRQGSQMSPEEAAQQLHKLANATKEGGSLPLSSTFELLSSLGVVQASAEEIASELSGLAEAVTNPPEGSSPSKARLASVLRQVVSKSLTEDAIVAHRIARRASEVEAGKLEIRDLKNLQKTLEDILVEARKNNTKDVANLAQKALKSFKFASSEDSKDPEGYNTERLNDKSSSFKDEAAEGEVWEEDNQKEASDLSPVSPAAVREGASKIKESAMKIAAAGENWKKVLFHTIAALDGVHRIGTAFDLPDVGYLVKARKAFVQYPGARPSTNFASSEEREARFEEGKPADPTENMSEEDAEKWKANTEKYKDQFKESSEDLWKAGSDPLA